MLGQIVATPVEAFFLPGVYSFTWNGRDDTGHFVSGGLYFYGMDLVQISGQKKTSEIRKMVLLR
jgi:flagellar hook assembly protein FlgD